ncbi:MAG: DUF5131 family protein [Anaerolineaceae bacterium]
MSTKIEWAQEVWNPVVGCTPASAGCAHCYAKRIFDRDLTYHSHRFEQPTCYPSRLEKPFHWKNPRRVFVNSMSDLFHPDVPFEFIQKVFVVMAEARKHTFMVLTKRPERMLEFANQYYLPGEKVNKNIWLGVTAENQETANARIQILLDTPAAMRFVSVEPMLGPVQLTNLPGREFVDHYGNKHNQILNALGPNQLDWVICGGETGPGARPMEVSWAQSLLYRCQSWNVPFFFKGWGGVIKAKTGRLLDGREWNEVPSEVK